MISQYIIQQILSTNKISTYLTSKGIHPERVNGGKTFYLCPLHKENNASFCLFQGDSETPYENYFCFGCKSHSTIINLIAGLETGGDWGAALRLIASKTEGLDESFNGQIDFAISHLRRVIEDKEKDVSKEEIEDLSLKISSICFDYIKNTNKSKEEIIFIDKIYSEIDKYIERNDIDSLRNAYNFMVDSGALSKRLERYLKKNGLD
jgi:hypothetical protein